jgi:hypothetical protein
MTVRIGEDPALPLEDGAASMTPADIAALIERLNGIGSQNCTVALGYEAAAALTELQAEVARLTQENAAAIKGQDESRIYDAWHEAASRCAELERERDALKSLLTEWRESPFFSSPREWRVWVDGFGPRVDAAIAAKRK